MDGVFDQSKNFQVVYSEENKRFEGFLAELFYYHVESYGPTLVSTALRTLLKWLRASSRQEEYLRED